MGLESIAAKVKKDIAENNTPLSERFCNALDTFLVDKGTEYLNERNANRRQAFNPSSYYGCKRKVYYLLSGFPETKKVTAVGERWTGVGTAQHRWVQDEIIMQMAKNPKYGIDLITPEQLPFYNQEGFEVIKEHGASPLEIKYLDYRFTKKIPISAMVDGAFTFLGRNVVFEFKTIKQEKFNTLFQPLKEHRAQGALYALTFNMPVMFLYICKNTQNWVPYFVSYTDDQLEKVRNRLLSIENSVLNHELPEKEKSEENCKYCTFKKYCNKNVVRLDS